MKAFTNGALQVIDKIKKSIDAIDPKHKDPKLNLLNEQLDIFKDIYERFDKGNLSKEDFIKESNTFEA